jgi:phosphoribosylamine--glycine ligase
MDILVVGNGGREHALAWRLLQSPELENLYVAEGNAGTGEIAENVSIDTSDYRGLTRFAVQNAIDLVVIGQDDALAAGVVDEMTFAGIATFGPTKAAAQIEASKGFSKQIMTAANVPTAEYGAFRDFSSASEFINSHEFPLYVKAGGLAKGKGAVECSDQASANRALHEIFVERTFGSAGDEVVIEAYLDGPEISLHALCDGQNYIMFPPSQDHKPRFDGDKGPNTGGMGAVAELPWLTKEVNMELGRLFVAPILKELAARGTPFRGLLYPGLKLTTYGPKIVEYNARFGDPETQSYMRILKTDLLPLLLASCQGELRHHAVQWSGKYAVSLALVAEEYPRSGSYGGRISGITDAESLEDVVIFHAGTKQYKRGVYTDGGRILNVTAVGSSISEAQDKVYSAAELIHFRGMKCRSDIGDKAKQQSPIVF